MTLGKREYTEADMLRMQRDAEERVREMHNRARVVVESDNLDMPFTQQRSRNWNSSSNGRRNNGRRGNNSMNSSARSAPEHQDTTDARQNASETPDTQSVPEPDAHQEHREHEEHSEPKKTTIVEDVMGALNLDEDYLLIIGLILILVNQRADTTLILALAYLLI